MMAGENSKFTFSLGQAEIPVISGSRHEH